MRTRVSKTTHIPDTHHHLYARVYCRYAAVQQKNDQM